jgi:hypothetical protein
MLRRADIRKAVGALLFLSLLAGRRLPAAD